MAQAVFTDDTQAAIQRRLAATRAAAQATVARAAPPTAAGIGVTDLGTVPTSITPADIANRAAQMRAQAPDAGIGSDVPAAARRVPGVNVGSVDPSTLTPAEQASFARQGYAPPPTANPGPAPVSTPAGSGTVADATPRAVQGTEAAAASRGIAANLVGRAGSIARAPFTPAGLTIGAGLTALDSYNRPTEDYDRRFGTTSDSLPKDLAVRTLGVGTDAAAGIADLPLSLLNAGRRAFGATPVESFTSILRQNDNPAAAHAHAVAQAAYNGSNMTAAAPTNAGFTDVSGGSSVGGHATPNSISGDIAALPGARSDNGNVIPFGKVVNGVRTFSDNSDVAGVPRTMSTADLALLATRAKGLTTADAGIGGGIMSEAAGRTLNLGEGAPQGSNRGFTAADRQAQYESIQQRGRDAEFSRLMGKSEMALSRGSRKTAGILADLATRAQGPQATPVAPSEAAANNARALAATAEATKYGAEAKRTGYSNNLLDRLNGESDPNKRQGILDELLASEGKNTGRVVTLKVPSGQTDIAGNPILTERPFDTRTRQYLDTPQAYGAQ